MDQDTYDRLIKRIGETEKQIASIEANVEGGCNNGLDEILLFNLNNQLMTMKILAALPDLKICEEDL